MEIKKLYKGQIIKNYKELCRLLDWEIESGNSKKSQLKELDRYYTYYKEGQKFIIDEVFQEPKEKEDFRKYNGGGHTGYFKQYDELNIKKTEYDNIGVYYILKDNNIYIGSTVSGFRQRFREHYNGYDELMKHTYELLQDGGNFNILFDMTRIEDEVLIRQVEDEYIQYFKNNTNYNVINKKENAYSITERTKPLVNKIIRVREDKYEQAIQLLIDNGLLDFEENDSSTNNYILDGVINDFNINNMPF